MSLTVVLALLVPILGGACIVCAAWPGERPWRADLPLIVALGSGLGVGVTSISFFVWLVAFGPSPGYFVVEGLAVATALGLAVRRVVSDTAPTARPHPPAPDHPSRLGKVLMAGFALAVTTAVITFAYRSAASPHGAWDASMIWNLRARFLFHGGEQWQTAFSNLLGPGTHADYPLLVPGAVARAWSLSGSDTVAVPVLLAAIFTFATAGILVGSLAALRGRSQGMLAGIVLFATLDYTWAGPSQLADVPFAFYVLATLVALALAGAGPRRRSGWLAVAGTSAGLAAWTKNEGLLFVAVLLAVQFVASVRRSLWRYTWPQVAALTLGLAPFLSLVVAFKWGIAPQNDLVAALSLPDILERLTSGWRYGVVMSGLATLLSSFSGWLLSAPLVLVVYLAAVGVRVEAGRREVLVTGALTIGLLLAGYFVVYIITPRDLAWHVETSMYRLNLHVWPSLLFLIFMAARLPEDAVGPRAVPAAH
jgi:hypothetical protein